MKVTYDRVADAAYIRLRTEIRFGQVAKQYHCDPGEVRGMINLNFDSEGQLLGIEILDAKRLLPKELLDEAEIIG
jgi:uncharacterized protein YuzE